MIKVSIDPNATAKAKTALKELAGGAAPALALTGRWLKHVGLNVGRNIADGCKRAAEQARAESK